MTLAKDTDRQEQFKAWLQSRRGLSQKTAGDANSRAKRAEKLLGEPLDAALGRGESVPGITKRLSEQLAAKGEGGAAERAVAGLQRAVRLYSEFRGAR